MMHYLKKFILILTFLITNCLFFFFYTSDLQIFLNDYLNPFTLTFKNPKTLQMFNIIILYHYVMAFLVGVIIFTFIFIFLSFFRTYFFFNYKTFYEPMNFCSFSEFLAYFRANLFNRNFMMAYDNIIHYIRISIIRQKNKNLEFYKRDIKASLTDQITHAPLLEFLWVIFPALILVLIAYPSIILLYYNEAYVEPVFNITVIGNQWFWTYEYNDFNLLKLFRKHISSEKTFFKKFETLHIDLLYLSKFTSDQHVLKNKKVMDTILASIPQRLTVDCNMIIAKDPKFLRLLTTDQCLVIPAKTPIRFLITSADVIHSWAIPSYGIKLDAVPGRINQQILTIPLMGTSWGQCSELCGVNHAFMPIEIKVLAFSDFLYYIQLKIKEILFPFLETYYKEKIKFVKKYVILTKDFVKYVDAKRFYTHPFKPWLLMSRMQWDAKKPTNYTLTQFFYFIFNSESPEFKKRFSDLHATKLVREIKRSILSDFFPIFRRPKFFCDYSMLLSAQQIDRVNHSKIMGIIKNYSGAEDWINKQPRMTNKDKQEKFMQLYNYYKYAIRAVDEYKKRNPKQTFFK